LAAARIAASARPSQLAAESSDSPAHQWLAPKKSLPYSRAAATAFHRLPVTRSLLFLFTARRRPKITTRACSAPLAKVLNLLRGLQKNRYIT
jgi:hypothetical protein